MVAAPGSETFNHYLEDSLSSWLSLNGAWEFQLGSAPATLLSLDRPCAWENFTNDKITDGPAFYRHPFTLPGDWLGKKVVLEADAISFDATVRVNGQVAGAHRGMWSPFQIDLTRFAHPGENALEIEVWKPGGRFPLRECLAGFLPDVCTTFGGIWQDIRLRAFSQAALHDLRVFTNAAGHLSVQGDITYLSKPGEAEVSVALLDAGQKVVARTAGRVNPGETSFAAKLETPGVVLWETTTGARYKVSVTLHTGAEPVASASRWVGFRDVSVKEGKTLLNSKPLHLRGVLDWGWDMARIGPPADGLSTALKIEKARALGFNLIKFCLFVPGEPAFEEADQAGMLLWLEMPMWLPRVTPEFKALALREYCDVFRRVHHHASIAVVSLGCELNAEADADFLLALNRLAREWFPNALICDNSGSAEAYGGVLTSLSDFNDYHFYTDPHFFQPLVQHFSRSYRPEKPWIYGEFCDADTLRDFGQLAPAPWWSTQPTALDREDFVAMRDYKRRLREAAIADEGGGLTRVARQQATAIRKHILEQVRANSAAGGYVVTGWTDTPITTSGVVDDFGNLKFPPEAWRPFNSDCVLAIDRERRRRWVGGDRPAFKDPYTWWQGEKAEIHLILSNGRGAMGRARLEWRLSDERGSEIAGGAQDIGDFPGGQVGELTVIKAQMPQASEPKPIELVLRASLSQATSRPGDHGAAVPALRQASEESTIAHNSWRLWAVPKPRLPARLAVEGPLLRRHNFAKIDREAQIVDAANAHPGAPLVAADLTEALLARVRKGDSALLWQLQPDERYTRTLPFWREAIHVFEPHALWEHVPHPGYADMRFFSVATDVAIDPSKLMALLGPGARPTHVWRRFDARAMSWADYLIEVAYGSGRMFVSSLRFEGGLGSQPTTFEANPIGVWMLAMLLGMLAGAI